MERRKLSAVRIAVLASLCLLAACDGGGGGSLTLSEEDEVVLPNVSGENCSVDAERFFSGGVPPQGIPELSNPELVGADGVADYLVDNDRVIGFFIDGQAYAAPHNILWFHEIINFDLGGERLAVTYCPLTGSSLAFDRDVVGGAEFAVSGLLFQNNLVMFEKKRGASLWPQMARRAGCGVRFGTPLTMFPVIEMTWGGWKRLHPDTRVVSSNTGFIRNYTDYAYPFGDYEVPDNPAVLDRRIPLDPRRPPKERVLGIPARTGLGGIAFPFGALGDTGKPVRAVHETVGGEEVVVFWDEAAQSAMAYYPRHAGQRLTFSESDGKLVDAETGSVWKVTGRAVSGPKAGARLEPVAEAYVAFWFAWAAFHPETRLWTGE